MWRLAVYLLAAAGVSLTASPARASCGDYVTVGAAQTAERHSREPGEPCDGPNCGRQSERPLPPAVPPAPSVDHPLFAATLPALFFAGPESSITDPAGSHPVGPSSRPERPPRS